MILGVMNELLFIILCKIFNENHNIKRMFIGRPRRTEDNVVHIIE